MHGNTLMSSHQDQVTKYDRFPEPGSPAQTEGWALSNVSAYGTN